MVEKLPIFLSSVPLIRGWHDICAARLTVIKERHPRSSKPQKWSHLQSNLRIWQEDKVRLNEVCFVSFDCQMIWWFQMISAWLRTWDIMRSYLQNMGYSCCFLFGTGWSDWSCKQGELWTRRTSIIATDNTGQYRIEPETIDSHSFKRWKGCGQQKKPYAPRTMLTHT